MADLQSVFGFPLTFQVQSNQHFKLKSNSKRQKVLEFPYFNHARFWKLRLLSSNSAQVSISIVFTPPGKCRDVPKIYRDRFLLYSSQVSIYNHLSAVDAK
jgi:hypothetical protein